MPGPKVTVIGAGSYFFGKEIIRAMATSEIMAGGSLALVDTSPEVLEVMARLAERIFAETGCGVRLLESLDRREVMADSDFIVLSFSERNMHYRGLDTRIAARHGIRMCSADTIGPAGIFRSLREVPRALAMARDASELAPDAWIINYVNPTAVIGIALHRYLPETKSFSLCDSHREPFLTLNWCKMVGILPPGATEVPPEVRDKLDLAIGGINHCTWMIRFCYEGVDMMPAWRQVLESLVEMEKDNPGEKSKARYNNAYALQLFDIYGAYPTLISHSKEYVPFFQGYGVSENHPEPIRLFDAEERSREMARAWKKTENYASGKLSVQSFLKDIGSEHATDIIESMWGGLGKPFYINTLNQGAVTNLPDDALLELRCDLDRQGPKPQPVGEFPRGLLALQHQILDTHELTAQAAVTGDRAILCRAMLTDPICNNIRDAEACIADLLEAQRDILPEYWY